MIHNRELSDSMVESGSSLNFFTLVLHIFLRYTILKEKVYSLREFSHVISTNDLVFGSPKTFGKCRSFFRKRIRKSKEPLNNTPYILVKHAIQAFFQNAGLIFTHKYAFFRWLVAFFSIKGQTSPLDLCCGKFSTGNRQRIQIGTGKQGIQTIFVFL